MINFKYIIGANIELSVTAKIQAAETETQTYDEVEIISVKDCMGLDVEIDDISIGSDQLDYLLEVAALEHRGHERQEREALRREEIMLDDLTRHT